MQGRVEGADGRPLENVGGVLIIKQFVARPSSY